MGWLDTFTKTLGGNDSSGGISDFDVYSGLSGFGSNDSNFGYDSSPSMADSATSFFEVPGTTNYGDTQATGVGGRNTSLAYNANGDLIETQGTGGDTSGGTTTTGGGGGGDLSSLISKYGLPALLALLAAKDRQKATGGGYGKAYQSPAPLTRTISQGKYGPIAKYAAEGGIIQGYAGGDSVRSSAGQLDQPDVGSMVGGITSEYDPDKNAKMVDAFARILNPLGMTVNDFAQKINAGDYKGAAWSAVPGHGIIDAAKTGDPSTIASAFVPSGVKALYNLLTSPPSQSSQAANYANAFGDPQGTAATNQAATNQAVQAANYASAFGNPEGTASNAENAAANAAANAVPTDLESEIAGRYFPPETNDQSTNTQGIDATQGNDLGAFNQGDNGAAPEPTGYTGPSYGGYDAGAGAGGGGNFNEFGPGEAPNYNLSESGGWGGGGGGGGINRDGEYAATSAYAQGGGIAAMAKGRFLRGPGDGVSDSIPATIDGNQPAALADGEFVIPARVVSELGNGSSEAGARKLHAMMVRIQQDRRGAKNIAANTKVDRHLPA